MRARFYLADGRVAEDSNVDERIVRYPLRDGKTLRWFTKTNDIDADGRFVFREVKPEQVVPRNSMRSDLLVNAVLAGVLGSRGKRTEKGDSGMTDALRLVRLAISAAAADGTLNDAERAAIVQQATADGLNDVVEHELANPRPLADLVSGVTSRDEAATLYVLAFSIVHADEQVTGAERIYLARLAQLLGLDAATVQSLEVDTGARIDALGDQGQPGG